MKISEFKIKKNIAIIIVVVLVVVLGAVLSINYFYSDVTTSTEKVEYSEDKYSAFLEELTDYVEDIDPNEDSETVNLDLIQKVIELQEKYEDGNGVSYAANTILNSITDSDSTESSTSDTTNSLLSMITALSNVYFADNTSTVTLSLSSETACNSSWIDSEYCLSNLSAEVYVTDSSSDKWVVLLHGYTMTGKQIYGALGAMYTSQGYNVLAVDLRGAGNSGGSTTMGYLESLDVYDWIKDLNTNWSSRYGVSVAPSTIVVHGVSLGGATTLQLATNPDIAAASGYPYTKTLTQLNVKGFVDDCGYTSMTKIVSDLFSLGDSEMLTVLTSYLDTTLESLMSTVEEISNSLNISGLESYFSSYDYSSGSSSDVSISEYVDSFSEYFNQVVEESQSSSSSTSTSEYTIPSVTQETVTEWWDSFSGYLNTSSQLEEYKSSTTMEKLSNSLGNLSPLSTTSTSSSTTDELVMKMLIKLVGVGLTEDNYEKYSNAFSDGRVFPEGSSVIIIHGTSDTIVDHSNSDIVANHILTTNDANLLYKWDITDGPHAGIVAGLNSTQYTNLIKNFVNCIGDSNQCSVFTSSDTEAALNS